MSILSANGGSCKISPRAIDYAKELNPQQFQAATSLHGFYLVIAGAGSGKTRTLVYRVAHLIEHGIDPQAILLLTFTRKAAREMMFRASAILDERCKKILGGTFHSYAHRLLRRYAREIGYASNFTVMDTVDAESLIKMVLNEPEFTEKKRLLPKAGTLLAILSKVANTGRPLEQVLACEYPLYKKLTAQVGEIALYYSRQKLEKSLMDFDDLLVYLKKLLQENRQISQQISESHHYVMVDEYQDTNKLQAEIVSLLAQGHGNLMVVGDDSQSIYSFRGADFKNIMAFPRMFPGCKVITLEQNYRSTQPILAFSNAVLNSAREKYSKRLFSAISGEHKPLHLQPKDEAEEARIVCQAIRQLQDDGICLSNIAVLFRAASYSNYIEMELTRQQIPFVKHGGIRFTESAHIKDMLALIRMSLNLLDVIAWRRILVLMEGVGDKTAAEIIHKVKLNGYDAMVSAKFYGKQYAPRLLALSHAIKQFQSSSSSLADKMRMLLEFYAPLLADNYDNLQDRTKDVHTLISMASGYLTTEEFLADITLEALENDENQQDTVTLSTIHSAKGLEWHTVFIIHLVEGLFPCCYALDNEQTIEEEHRLFYVAVTRARTNLCLMSPKAIKNAKMQYLDPRLAFSDSSRFLTENEDVKKLVEEWAV